MDDKTLPVLHRGNGKNVLRSCLALAVPLPGVQESSAGHVSGLLAG